MDVHEMRVFAKVASHQNISAAAAELNMTPGNVSKRVQALEASLGVRLFDRSTRLIRITEEGRILLAYAERVLNDIEEACAAVTLNSSTPRGLLRVTAPAALGRRWVIPGICDFLKKYPEISLSVSLTDRLVDLIDEGFDVAIRTGPLPDSQLIAKSLVPDKYFVLASPDYLATNGTPATPKDLEDHNCLILGEHSYWLFTRDNEQTAARVKGSLVANSAEMLLEAATEGIGIIRTSQVKALREIERGRLVRVLTDYDVAGDSAIWAIFPSSRLVPLKLRVFLDFFAQRFMSIRQSEHIDVIARRKVQPANTQLELNG
ncbi:MAG: LysR family transcriptional regulator [Hyphomicrobiaceae bacterium]